MALTQTQFTGLCLSNSGSPRSWAFCFIRSFLRGINNNGCKLHVCRLGRRRWAALEEIIFLSCVFACQHWQAFNQSFITCRTRILVFLIGLSLFHLGTSLKARLAEIRISCRSVDAQNSGREFGVLRVGLQNVEISFD